MYRPLFECLGMVTCRTFETPAAGDHPAVHPRPGLCPRDLRRPCARSWCSARKPHEKILDVLARPEHYAEIVREIRQEFGRRHSPEARLRELIGIIEE